MHHLLDSQQLNASCQCSSRCRSACCRSRPKVVPSQCDPAKGGVHPVLTNIHQTFGVCLEDRAQKGPEETPGSRRRGKEEMQKREGTGRDAQAAVSDGPAGAILVGSPLDTASSEVTSKPLAIPGLRSSRQVVRHLCMYSLRHRCDSEPDTSVQNLGRAALWRL